MSGAGGVACGMRATLGAHGDQWTHRLCGTLPASRSLRAHNSRVTADHYFSAEPAAPERRAEVEFAVGRARLQAGRASGVFSAGRLDPGTAVLLRKADLPTAATGGTLLDLGCGYGPIACVLASEAPRRRCTRSTSTPGPAS